MRSVPFLHVQALQYFNWPFQCGVSFVDYVIYALCLPLLYCLVCSLQPCDQPCDHLLAKGWSLGTLVCVVMFSCVLSLSRMVSGVELDLWFFPYFQSMSAIDLFLNIN